MDWFETVVTYLDAWFKTIVILISSAFAIYFSVKKIGQKVSAQYSFGAESFEPTHIKEVVLSNKKDKPVNIYAIHAVFHEDLWLELEEFSPPRVLKPYESLSLLMKPYSFLSVGEDKFEPDFLSAKIYLESDNNVIKCDSMYRPQLLENYRKVSAHRYSYNGFIYDENVSFILTYILDGAMKVAFIHESGYIGNEWGLSPNHLGKKATESSIKGMVQAHKLDGLFSSFILYKVEDFGVLKRL